MKKYSLILLLLIHTLVSAQSLRFSVLSSPEIGSKDSQNKFLEAVKSINFIKDIDFTIVDGNISENGKNSQLATAKDILANLESEYFVIPGEFDSRLSESGSRKFYELFDDDKFIYEKDSLILIGINSSTDRQIGGHIKPEDYKWAMDNLSGRDSSFTVLFFVYHSPKDEIDNWFKINNLLSSFRKKAVIYGSAKEYNFDKLFNIPLISIPRQSSVKNQILNIFESRNDSLFIYDWSSGKTKLLNKFSLNNKEKSEIIESPLFNNFDTEIMRSYDLNYTLEADLISAEGYIYACDKSGLITCLDTTGNVIWEYDAFGTIINSPVVADGIFAAATLQGDLLTLNALTGESIQTIGFDDVITTPLITFDYNGAANFMIPKLSDSKAAVVLGTATGKLYCYDLETLQQIWIFDKVKGMIAAKPVYIENKIIFPAFDNSLYCVNSLQGWLNWKWNGIKNSEAFPVLCSPVANNENVYLVSTSGSVYAVDLLLGRTEWVNDKLRAFESIGISEIGHRLFIKSRNDKFHIISAKTSNWVKEINIKYGEDFTNSKPIEYNGQVLLGTKSGNVYLIDEKFKLDKLLYLGSAAINSIEHIEENIFAVSNNDGKIVLFKIK